MRRLAVLGGVSIALVAAAACAESEELSEDAIAPSHDEPKVSIPEAGAAPSEAGVDSSVDSGAPAPTPVCSPPGWCETSLPDSDLVMRDIWPLPDRAFAIAENATSELKVLEWTGADSTWRYIDDNSQNEALAELAVRIWAPNADEVYFAVSPATIYRGTRPKAPATAWSWTSERLPDNNPANVNHGDATQRRLTVGVWGTGSDDVYAWYSNTIFRRKSEDGGAPTWVAELIADDFDAENEYIFITGATGKSAADVWFAASRRQGTRAPCDILIRKTSEGYVRVADGVVPATSTPCTARAGVPLVLGGTRAWQRNFQSPDGEHLFSLKGQNSIIRVGPNGSDYSVSTTSVPNTMLSNAEIQGFWAESEDLVWLGVRSTVSFSRGSVLRGNQPWADGGAYEYSSIAQNGAPSYSLPLQIRGTSNTNIWAVGDRYAIHKSTP